MERISSWFDENACPVRQQSETLVRSLESDISDEPWTDILAETFVIALNDE